MAWKECRFDKRITKQLFSSFVGKIFSLTNPNNFPGCNVQRYCHCSVQISGAFITGPWTLVL